LNAATQDFIDKQLEYIESMCEVFQRDLFWKYAKAYIEQLRYVYRGFLTRINEENALDMHIGFSQFCYLTNVGDLEDLIPAFSTEST
jgi:hypothetical protein